MSLKECAQYCKTVFDLNSVRIYGDEDAPVETIAIVPGAGDDYIKNALAMGADVFITGDIGHHDGLDAMEQGLADIDASHYGIEKLFVPYMAEVFANRMPELIVIKATQKEPFTVV
jgi:putative NIF3 family GTP cyclohydrolase 1 type 2